MTVRDELKAMEGDKVYLSPTGNNARRGGKNELRPAVIVKVAKVYITVMHGTHNHTEKLKINDHVNGIHVSDGHNGGYHIWRTQQDYRDHVEASRIGDRVRAMFYSSKRPKFDVDTMRQVAKLLGIKEG